MFQKRLPPIPMVDFSAPLLKAAAVIAGVKLGLFYALAEGPQSINYLATRLNCDETGMTRLVEALVGFGYIDRRSDLYTNAPIAHAWLTQSGVSDYTSGVLWAAELWHLFEGLDLSVKQGGPDKTIWHLMEENREMSINYAHYMQASAKLTSEFLVKKVPLSGNADWLLDLGGSHGLRSIEFCRHYPNVKAVVFDSLTSLEVARECVDTAGMNDRIVLRPGDCLKDDFGQGYDVVLCVGLLHNLSVVENRKVLEKIAKALNPGGQVVIHEYLRAMPVDVFSAGFSLLMFLTSGTRMYQYEEFAEWFLEVGLERPVRIELGASDQGYILTARRADRY